MGEERDFAPATQDLIQLVSLVILIVMALVALGVYTGFVRPAPWSPMAQHAEAPISSGIFNPDATLDTSRMGDR